MLALRSPSEAYRRVDFDARVTGANPGQLVGLCYEQLVGALGSALFADERGDNRAKSAALTRSIAALTALRMGVSEPEGIGQALVQYYEAARQGVLDSVLTFDAARISAIRQDVMDIAEAMQTATN